jgi:uncharacterized membrane-anchored protein YjiN (DUF445 family)
MGNQSMGNENLHSGSVNINQSVGSVIVTGKVTGDVNVGVTGNQDLQIFLQDLCREIRTMLTDMDKSYPTHTTSGKLAATAEVVERVEADPKLRARVMRALKSGAAEALAQALNHPLSSFVIAALKDWHETQANQ